MYIVLILFFVVYNYIGFGYYSVMNECFQIVDLKEDVELKFSEKRECVQRKCRCGRLKFKMMF